MRAKRIWAGIGLVATLVTITVVVCNGVLAGPKVHVGRVCQEPNRPSLEEVDHSAYDALLKKYVDERGMVAYGAWKGSAADSLALDEYLIRLGCVDLSKSAATKAKLAFWINAYNALTLKGIMREYPTSSIRNHTSKFAGYNIWKDLLLIVDGRSFSLEGIEHSLLRKMDEPRIHFAIVCASKGCPPLLNQAYTAARLDDQLGANARKFFAQPTNFRADAGRRVIAVSQLLQWYGGDFAPTSEGQIRVLRPYFPNADELAWIDQGGVSVRHLDYDWGLNDQR